MNAQAIFPIFCYHPMSLVVIYKKSGEQICLSHQLYRDICRVLKLRPTKALGPGRGVTNSVETLQALEVDGFSDPTSAPDLLSGLASSSVAHNISVENVALPDDAGRVDPCMILSEPYLSDFKDFENRLIRPPPLAEELPVPCHKVLRKDEKQLRHTLLQNHMASIIREEDIEHTSDGRLLLSGLFGVPTHGGKMRFIFDKRAPNAGERRMSWVVLPHGTQFCQLVLDPLEGLRASGTDLSKYF